eukprot:279506-Pyramimonas_sp.AAC.1
MQSTGAEPINSSRSGWTKTPPRGRGNVPLVHNPLSAPGACGRGRRGRRGGPYHLPSVLEQLRTGGLHAAELDVGRSDGHSLEHGARSAHK